MKIAFLSYYSGLVNRGAETFVHELANYLVQAACQVKVFQGGPKSPTALYSIAKLNSINHLPHLDSDLQILIPINGGLQALQAKVWALKNHKQLLIVGESGLGLDDRLNLLTFPDVFIGLTSYQCTWASHQNPFVRVEKIPNGIDSRKFNPTIKKLKLNIPSPVVLFVGAFTSAKRPETCIRAVAQTPASLLLVGQGNRQNELTKLCETLLPHRFQIISIPYDQMPMVYPAADLFTYPTVPWESFGISLLEAMASGLGVVASDDPIRREIVGPAGLFIDPTDTAAYSNAINLALANRHLATLAQKQAREYDWQVITGKYLNLFSSLIT